MALTGRPARMRVFPPAISGARSETGLLARLSVDGVSAATTVTGLL